MSIKTQPHWHTQAGLCTFILSLFLIFFILSLSQTHVFSHTLIFSWCLSCTHSLCLSHTQTHIHMHTHSHICCSSSSWTTILINRDSFVHSVLTLPKTLFGGKIKFVIMKCVNPLTNINLFHDHRKHKIKGDRKDKIW